MTVNDELMWKLYPEWNQPNPFHPILQIFLVIAIMLLIPYLYTKLVDSMVMQERLAAMWKKIRPPRSHLNQLLSV